MDLDESCAVERGVEDLAPGGGGDGREVGRIYLALYLSPESHKPVYKV